VVLAVFVFLTTINEGQSFEQCLFSMIEAVGERLHTAICLIVRAVVKPALFTEQRSVTSTCIVRGRLCSNFIWCFDRGTHFGFAKRLRSIRNPSDVTAAGSTLEYSTTLNLAVQRPSNRTLSGHRKIGLLGLEWIIGSRNCVYRINRGDIFLDQYALSLVSQIAHSKSP